MIDIRRNSQYLDKICWIILKDTLFVLLLFEGVSPQIFLGGSCTFGGYSNVRGECKHLANCPSAISNFRAGISPALCYKEDDVSVICCQSEKRISEKKCDAYARKIAELQKNVPSFIPLSAGGFDDSSNRPIKDSTCDGLKFSAFIVGGRNAEKHEMSFAVALGYEENNKTEWFCGGTLISEQFAISASHCLDGKIKKPPNVILLGDKNLKRLDSFSSQHRIEAKVEKIFIHPDYQRPAKYNDIGLIKLEKKVTFNRGLLPACLPKAESRPESIRDFIVAGWGLVEYLGKQSETLQMTNLARLSQQECSQSYKSDSSLFPNGIVKSQICAGDKTGRGDSCNGDSGGPLTSHVDKATCLQTLLGVVSNGAFFCGQGDPGIYTNVQSYLDWIESIVWEDEIE